MFNKSEDVYCEGGDLDGRIITVAKGTRWFNTQEPPHDYGNGPQVLTHHYERTERTKNGATVFYSNPDWDR